MTCLRTLLAVSAAVSFAAAPVHDQGPADAQAPETIARAKQNRDQRK